MFKALLIFLLSSSSVMSADWTWGGFEILGNHSVGREEIIKHLPIRLGEKYSEDVDSWKKWCQDLVTVFSFSAAECSSVRFIDFKVYFVVDVVEKWQEYRNQFRKVPADDLVLADEETMKLYHALQKRLWELFGQGKPSPESWDKGYLDYADPQMHTLVQELVKRTPAFRKSIIQVLSHDRDPVKRMSAADLLNWAGKGSKSVLRTHRLLDDPHSGVRNQLSRFMSHFVAGIQSERKLKKVIDSLLIQLDRPSHGDRNKALWNLFEILKAKPHLASHLKKGLPLIRYVAENSVLSNVSDLAKDVVKQVEGHR